MKKSIMKSENMYASLNWVKLMHVAVNVADEDQLAAKLVPHSKILAKKKEILHTIVQRTKIHVAKFMKFNMLVLQKIRR